MPNIPDAQTAQLLLNEAKQAAEKAYSPYSQFAVGAALFTESGKIYTGVNVENVSYGLTLCAERTAVVKAVSEGHQKFTGIAVWGKSCPDGAITPCGACRQVLAEFMQPNALVITGKAGSIQTFSLAALLPEAFGPASGLGGNSPHTGSNTPGA